MCPRNNTYKKKRRSAKYTAFVFGEGKTEKAFLQFVKKIFTCNDNFVYKVEAANGGAPVNIVEKAIRICSARAYNKSFVVFDGDVPFDPSKALMQKAKKYKMEIIQIIPCIEGFFLDILQDNRINTRVVSSQSCKKFFEDNYLDEKQKLDPREYAKIFSKQKLEERQVNMAVLNKIIQIFTP